MLLFRMILLFCVCLFSCGSPQKEKKELRINILSEPVTLDPGKVRHLQGFSLTTALFEGLTRLNAQGEAELALALSYTLSEDECHYTFHLRKAEWTNGEPVTAHDFAYAWKRLLQPDFPGDLAFSLYDIKNAEGVKKGEISSDSLGIKAIDLYTLEVTLERKTPYFLQLLATPAFFPIHEKTDRTQQNWATNADTYVSNGPFCLQKWEHHHMIALEKNKHYWDQDSVKLSHIQMAMVGDENTELHLFERGEIDWMGSPLSTISLAAIPHLKKNATLHTKPLCGTALIRVNTECVPLNQIEVRRALSLSLNREEILEGVTHGTQIPAHSLLPDMLTFQEENLFTDGIKQENPSLGFSEISLMYANSERFHLIAQAIQDQWMRAFGIKVNLEPLETKVYYSRLNRKDYQLAMGSLTADFIDPSNLLEVFKYRQGSNNTQWENEHYIHLLERAKSTFNGPERAQLLGDAEKLLMDEMPIIPIFHFNMLYLKKTEVENVVLLPSGVIDFKWADIKS